ncbi:MAG: GH92 family glycosyl hydrolase [Sedimentisphaerales bacterium]|nr:GH92 family glycosyl hydrolase [Sedimentisphaerales bacterium]
MTKFLTFLLIMASSVLALPESPIEYVNPLMGTDSEHLLSNGNTYPAIALPWGMNFWMPQTGNMGDGWAYTYDAHRIKGFKQTHQPSPWINDYGQFAVMPVTGELEFDQEKRASFYSHKTEVARPNSYKVYLADYDLTTELTATERAAFFRFTFPESQNSYIIVDAFDNGSYVKIIPSENKIEGYTTKNSGGVPANFKNYFVIIFDKPFTYTAAVHDKNIQTDKLEAKANHAGGIIGFSTKNDEVVHARVASSFISMEQAYLNLHELKADFDSTKAYGEKVWNDTLGTIEVQHDDIDILKTFYSCMYRAVLFPRQFHEINADGQVVHYSPYNGQILPGYLYTDTGFWDTYRSLIPFVNLVFPTVGERIQEGLLNAYLESGFYPEWASPGHRDCMVGNGSTAVIADAFVKGLVKVDAQKMYEGMLYSVNNEHPQVRSSGRLGCKYYNELGYVPHDVNIRDNASRTLEYAYNDWCIYQVGKRLNRPAAELELYLKRSLNYKNHFNKDFNMMSGRKKDGSFPDNFDPVRWWDAFTEGNSWHYTWSVFHDIQGLIDLMGGEQNFIDKLDAVFSSPPSFGGGSTKGNLVHEMREMQIINMGQYAHGNQPIQHMIYLYNYAGKPWKTQYWIREAMERLYQPTPDGYCGDEDNGQTSAWYVFSALGFYSVCPGANEYVIGSPLFKSARIKLENGKEIVIKSQNNSPKNVYINSLKLNGSEYDKNYFTYDDFQKGALIDFDMASEPNKTRGTKKSAWPYSLSNE